jgi:hypothetical protein
VHSDSVPARPFPCHLEAALSSIHFSIELRLHGPLGAIVSALLTREGRVQVFADRKSAEAEAVRVRQHLRVACVDADMHVVVLPIVG